MSTWTIPSGASESDSVWFGLEAVLGCSAPAMTALTTGLQLQSSNDPMSVLDADTTFRDVTVEGTLAKFQVSASVGRSDTLTNLVRYNRLRVKAVDASDVAKEQGAERAINASTVRL